MRASPIASGGGVDEYEIPFCVRVKAPLAAGIEAWVYVDARGKPPGITSGGMSCAPRDAHKARRPCGKPG